MVGVVSHCLPAWLTDRLPYRLTCWHSTECVELITKLLAYDPDDRISARQAVKHPYFRDFREADKRATHQAQNMGALSTLKCS